MTTHWPRWRPDAAAQVAELAAKGARVTADQVGEPWVDPLWWGLVGALYGHEWRRCAECGLPSLRHRLNTRRPCSFCGGRQFEKVAQPEWDTDSLPEEIRRPA